MDKNGFVDWVHEIKGKMPGFISRMENDRVAGKFKLSLSGDRIPPDHQWGLAQSTFAARILYILNLLSDSQRAGISEYILRFRRTNGAIFDPFVKKKSLLNRLITVARGGSPDEWLFYRANERAETRQAYAALINLGDGFLNRAYTAMPYDEPSIRSYLEKLNWHVGGAGSNINHLLFFIRYNPELDHDTREHYVDIIEDYIGEYYHPDGLFYSEKYRVDLHLKITFTMKIIMGLAFFGRQHKWINRELAETLMDEIKPEQACQNFNPILLLSEANDTLIPLKAKIQEKVLAYAQRWRDDYYYDVYGAFSFGRRQAVKTYYMAAVTKGRNEPDLHGTAMFVWGILLIAKILDLDKNLRLRTPVL